jgi:hypothetical protein
MVNQNTKTINERNSQKTSASNTAGQESAAKTQQNVGDLANLAAASAQKLSRITSSVTEKMADNFEAASNTTLSTFSHSCNYYTNVKHNSLTGMFITDVVEKILVGAIGSFSVVNANKYISKFGHHKSSLSIPAVISAGFAVSSIFSKLIYNFGHYKKDDDVEALTSGINYGTSIMKNIYQIIKPEIKVSDIKAASSTNSLDSSTSAGAASTSSSSLTAADSAFSGSAASALEPATLQRSTPVPTSPESTALRSSMSAGNQVVSSSQTVPESGSTSDFDSSIVAAAATVKKRVTATVAAIKGKVAETAAEVKESAASAAETVKDSATSAAATVSEKAHEAATTVKENGAVAAHAMVAEAKTVSAKIANFVKNNIDKIITIIDWTIFTINEAAKLSNHAQYLDNLPDEGFTINNLNADLKALGCSVSDYTCFENDQA